MSLHTASQKHQGPQFLLQLKKTLTKVLCNGKTNTALIRCQKQTWFKTVLPSADTKIEVYDEESFKMMKPEVCLCLCVCIHVHVCVCICVCITLSSTSFYLYVAEILMPHFRIIPQTYNRILHPVRF